MGKITKAVIPAAGLGTRFLPATKAMPKEMLPIVDKPVMQYVVEEAVGSGLQHVLMITGRNKNALENHFDRAVELESLLDEKGDQQKLTRVLEATELADLHYVRQGDPLGLGHAVLKAQTFVGNETFALLLGDEIVENGDQFLGKMLEYSENNQTSVVALMKVPEQEIHKYGVARVGREVAPGVLEVKGFVEKPSAIDAPSDFAIVGRYVLRPEIFSYLKNQTPGFGGEIQLTDSLSLMAESTVSDKPSVVGMVLTDRRHDTGDKLSFLKATVEIACERDDLGVDFHAWLINFVNSQSTKAN